MTQPIHYFDWDALFSRRHRNLPHLCQEGVVYFVTFRLRDSIPQSRLQYWRWQSEQWLQQHPPPHSEADLEQIRNLCLRRVERFLDRGHGSCLLKAAEARDSLESPMRERDGVDYALGDYVIMPNHVHILFRPLATVELGELLGPWRSISAKEISRLTGHQGALWQEEQFDHIVRGPESLTKFRRYIQNNPLKCRPGTTTSGCGSLFSSPPTSGGS